jgi:hypothetical protein
MVILFLLGTTSVPGAQSALTLISWFLFYTAQVAASILDPNIYVLTTTANRDGLKIKIKRPLVGFIRFETQTNPLDSNEDQPTRWRPRQIHERALLRI